MPHSPGPGTVTLFDLDGVLVHGDTTAALITHRLLRRPWRIVLALPLFLGALLAPARGALRPRLHRALTRLALHGLGESEYAELTRLIVTRLISSGRVNDTAVETAKEALSQGSVIVVTAAEHRLARTLLHRIGLTRAGLFASQLTVRGRRWHVERHNVGTAKVKALRAAGVDPREAVFYSDSASDLPLLRASARPLLVNPGRRSRRAVSRALPGVAVLLWR